MSESLFSVRNALRILALILLCVMLFITIKNSVVISKGNEKIQAQQLETLTKVLISQASLSASEMILTKDQERLLQLTNQLAQDRLVFDATIYDAQGVRLASSEEALSVREVLGLDTPLATASIGRQQLVEPVFADGALIGFVRVTFETGRVTAISDHHYRKSDRYMYMMVLMSFVCGMLFILILRRQPIRRKKAPNLLLTK
ncbi:MULTISPECIES: YtjB family periplasmic protein [Vibrio]|uniref:SMP protein n=3 Tax=Vibrio harveyi group TaxID=717610 RepID=A0A0H0YCX1_VIBAL|nr:MULTISPECIES: YtjB family periplasmic protein [Vibrio]MDW1808156.1 YtjB family periplasmic protein [Vibrio sp. Vb2362]MDW1970693.1 YtjB family periplasmic protein [Vibrio sp. 945]MDW2257779.1 YtjB family periplasmic protein [Vibrio sp. 1409]MDW2295016.1 YtjB family periplasmic protein [Vibrio sp. 1404]NAW93084.1 SMP protein [Vibrio sp. V42_P2S4T144]QCO86964.1 SMP protein [Vibrio neocaledonicus]QIR89428.1 SMP protein [Vibrio diabolicus]GAJ70925.1 lipoate-protein ligase A [Vibrio sp. JCM 1